MIRCLASTTNTEPPTTNKSMKASTLLAVLTLTGLCAPLIGAEPTIANRKRAHRIAVVRPSKRQVPLPARHALVGPILERDLDCLFNSRSTVGSEQQVRAVHRK